MTPIPVPQRWLLALLGAVFLLELMLSGEAMALLGAAGLLACVYLGVSRPGLAAAIGSAVLVASSFVSMVGDGVSEWTGIENVLLSEVLAGGALVVLLAWRATLGRAVAGTAALVIACLAAMVIRSGRLFDLRTGPFVTVSRVPDPQSVVFGFILLMICVGVGVYLRQTEQQRVDSELRTLVRRQWPLAAALTVLVLFDVSGIQGFVTSDFDSPYLSMPTFALVGGMVAAGCAVLAPRAPVAFALTGSAAIALVTLPLLAIERAVGVALKVPFSLTQVGASMALVAIVVRQAKPQQAAWSTAALVAVNLTAILDTDRYRNINEVYLPPMGLLLILSVATGLYFRARDRERNQSVRVAVSGAQNAERLALARELHDVVAHHVTGIVVQAQAARLVADRDPMVAVGALEKIETSGTEALTAMRMLVGSLRTNQPAGESTAASQATSDLAADIRALVDQFPGPTVHLELSLPETMPTEMGRSVLRLVQESLTNVSKHATGATAVQVGVSTGSGDFGEELHVFVKDDGTARRGAPAGGSGGYGLIGMRERVELLGGFFSAGPGDDGGWLVKIALPLRSR